MEREKKLEQTLENSLSKPIKHLNGGWIYTDDFRTLLENARKTLPESNKQKNMYPDPSPSFHVIQQ